ncbi:MAG TPA: DUF1697 domain-containing protein [Pirellulaceae bacterium]|nr:DUF1697 domain-containing protein [Pirellulaceae bacterium]
MPSWVVLFRGVNVGGKHKLPMARLVTILESLGCSAVRTYIQSGNAVFTSRQTNRARLATQIVDTVEREFGFRPHLMLLTASELADAVLNNPFKKSVKEPKSLHFFFLDSKPQKPDVEGMKAVATRSERFRLIGQVFYLHTPDGFGLSKLATVIERRLGVPATARNYNTVAALMAMLEES